MKAVSVDLDELIQNMLSDHKQRKTNKIDEALSISVFSTDSAGEERSTSGINGYFIHSQLLIDCLIRMKSTSNDKTELLSLCRTKYQGDKNELKTLEEFQRDYSPNDAVRWYTRESCLYRFLNKALRVQNIDLLFLFRFFIRDIERQLDSNRCTSSIHIYRGQLMSKDEVDMLKNNVNEFISINSFLSTSLNRELALFFLADSNVSNDFERVFFEIDADPCLENIKPFSNITSHSYFASEEEVLFMIGSIFQLVHVCRNQDGIWIVQMRLCTSNDHQLTSLVEHLRNEYKDEEKTLMSFGDILLKMDKFDNAEKYYHLFLDKLSPDDKYTARCYHALGSVAMRKDDLNLGFNWFYKALEAKRRTSALDDSETADIYNSLGMTYRKNEEFDRSIEMFKKALAIWKETLGNNSSEVAQCYHGIGFIYYRNEQFSKALEYHQKALDINEKLFPKHHTHIGISHNSITATYRCLKELDLALEHANLALEIFQKSLPFQHSQIGWVYENIGLIYEQQGKLQEALLYLEKAINMYRLMLPSTHYYITNVQENIRRVTSKLK